MTSGPPDGDGVVLGRSKRIGYGIAGPTDLGSAAEFGYGTRDTNLPNQVR